MDERDRKGVDRGWWIGRVCMLLYVGVWGEGGRGLVEDRGAHRQVALLPLNEMVQACGAEQAHDLPLLVRRHT